MQQLKLKFLGTALALACSAQAALAGSAEEDARTVREDQLKAGYLFNFAKFVEWPSSATTDVLTICFRGANGVQDALATGLESKRVGNRRLAVRQLADSEAADGCGILYLDARTTSVRSVGSAKGATLTVSDLTDFTRAGGMIKLFTENNRLRFVINVDNAQRAGLRISSNLLQLASSVEKEGSP